MFKKVYSFVFLAFSLILSLVSCSNADQSSVLVDETPTLRYTATSLRESTIWTEEVEVDRLTSNISAVPGISSHINLSPLIVLACDASYSSKIFPVLSGFGSLDTSLIPSALREMLVSFSDSIAKGKDADSFMSKESLYSLSLFYIDFNKIFNDCFELDKKKEDAEKAAETKKSEKAELSEASENSKEGTEAEELAEKTIYFGSYIFGQPFLDGVCYEVPVKFFGEKASMTLCVFCVENSGSWKVDQIQLTDWEIMDGKK